MRNVLSHPFWRIRLIVSCSSITGICQSMKITSCSVEYFSRSFKASRPCTFLRAATICRSFISEIGDFPNSGNMSLSSLLSTISACLSVHCSLKVSCHLQAISSTLFCAFISAIRWASFLTVKIGGNFGVKGFEPTAPTLARLMS